MNKLIENLKKFFTNKNTVTFLGLILGVGILFFGYQKRVNDAINPVSIPYAKVSIKSGTIITSDMIGMIKVSSSFLKNVSVYKNMNSLIGKSVNVGSTIPAGGLFYEEQIVNANELPDAIWSSIEKTKMIYYLDLGSSGMKDTYGNAIDIGEYIDIYASVSSPKTYGLFVENVKVIDIRNSQGNSIKNGASPSIILFEVNSDSYDLLVKAGMINDIELKAVPKGHRGNPESGEEIVTSEVLKNYIMNNLQSVN